MSNNEAAMKVQITLTTESGVVFEGEIVLTAPGKTATKKTSRAKASRPKRPEDSSSGRSGSAPDVSLPLRPFLREQVRGKSGAAKVTLLIAHLAGGDTDVEVDSIDVLKAWNRATAFLGEYNRAHATRAKDYGWIDSPKHGVYKLRNSWVDAG